MKLNNILIMTLLLIFSSCNETNVKKELAFQTITTQQMYEDFDYLVNSINVAYCRIELMKVAMGIDIPEGLAELRSSISNINTTRDFVILLNQALYLTQDKHNHQVKSTSSEYRVMKKYGVVTEEEYSIHKKYDLYFPRINLHMPFIYHQGEYKVFHDFTNNGTIIYSGEKITHVNEIPVHEYVKGLTTDINLLWDNKYKRVYSSQFYNTLDFYYLEKHMLRFEDSKGNSIILDYNKKERVRFPYPYFIPFEYSKNRKSKQGVVLHFLEHNTISLRLVTLHRNPEVVPPFMPEIDNIINNYDVDKIVIDLRGCPGGNVNYLPNILSYLYGKAIPMEETVGMKYPHARVMDTNRYNYLGEKNIGGKGENTYHVYQWKGGWLNHSTNKMNYTGKVYLLFDEWTYSATTTMQRMALDWPEVITVGQPSNFEQGGAVGTYPLYLILPHSRFPYRLINGIYMKDSKDINDFLDYPVEISVIYSWNQLIHRLNYQGDIYGKIYLGKYDPLMQTVFRQLVNK